MEYVNFFRIKGAEDEQVAAAPIAGQRGGGTRRVARAVAA
jgi:hypothetical protein